MLLLRAAALGVRSKPGWASLSPKKALPVQEFELVAIIVRYALSDMVAKFYVPQQQPSLRLGKKSLLYNQAITYSPL